MKSAHSNKIKIIYDAYTIKEDEDKIRALVASIGSLVNYETKNRSLSCIAFVWLLIAAKYPKLAGDVLEYGGNYGVDEVLMKFADWANEIYESEIVG